MLTSHGQTKTGSRLKLTQLSWVELSPALWTLWRRDSTQLNSTENVHELSWVGSSERSERPTRLNSTSWVELSWVESGALNWALRIRLQFHYVHHTALTMIRQIMHYETKIHKIHRNRHKWIYAQWNWPSETKPNPENCKNCSSKFVYNFAQLQYTVQHRTVLIISPLTFRQPW